MLAKLFRVCGLVLIIGFSAVSIFFSLVHREVNDPRLKKLMSYPSYFEDRLYDFRMNLNLDKTKVDDRLVLAMIDDKSITKIGRWPWSRKVWGDVIKKLEIYGAKVLPFDVFFPEPEKACGCGAESPDLDMAKAIREFQAIEGNKVILGYSMNTIDADFFKEVPESLYNYILDTKQAEGVNLAQSVVSKAAFPIPLLQETEAGLGHVQTAEDADGIYRHYQLLSNVEEIYFPSYSLLAYSTYTGDSPHLELLGEGDYRLKVKTGELNLNHRGETKVRWLGGTPNFPRVPILDILEAPDDDPKMKKILGGNVVFIGSTAFGAHDLRHTPVDAMLPGVYFHMNMTHMLLEGKFFKSKEESTMISWGVLLGGCLLIILIQLIGNALLDIVVLILLGGGIFLADTYYLLPMGYEIKLFFSIIAMMNCYSWNTFLNFYFANKDKQFLKNAFGNYISPELIDEMYSSGEPPKLGGDSGIRTAYFTDIQSFSSFSEQLSATKLVELLNEYLSAMTDILLEHGGTLDKYEGDAIIAFFGAPMPLPDHANRACIVAVEMQEKLLELREKWVADGDKWPQIVHEMRMRIGLNTGEIVTGNMGSAVRMNYTMMGDSVNLAARLEESAKQYGIFTQVSSMCKDEADPDNKDFTWRELDTVRVVGKSEPVQTFELICKKKDTDENIQKLVDKFSAGLECYKQQKWDEAIANFKESVECEYIRFPLLKGKKKNPSEIYIERCEAFKETPPPPDWDGVYTLTSK